MNTKRNVIITCGDASVGDFIVNEWLRSLVSTTNLTDIHVAILDYGFTESQRAGLRASGVVELVPCIRDGHVVTLRFRDMATYLATRTYDQVMATDGGDVIFQEDIGHLFKENTEAFRAACEDFRQLFDDVGAFKYALTENIAEEVHATMRTRLTINAGVLLGPRERFVTLCQFCFLHIKRPDNFGPDQALVGYYLYTHGFVQLARRYNFISYMSRESFSVRDGYFYDEQQRRIAIVHNAGRFSTLRAIRNFGYGPGHNHLKRIRLYTYRALLKLFALWQLRRG